MKKIFSPLRYPGGKAKLGPWLAELITYNNLNNTTYIEPYAGGAGASLYLLFNNYVKKIIINDIDIAIYAIWHSILNETDHFIKKLINTNIDIKTWEDQKEIITHPEKYSLFDLGFAAFFLNRTNVSGVIKGGPIGGKNQQGKFKIDARFKKNELINRIKNIAEYRKKIEIYNKDAIEFITQIKNNMSNKYFIYLDPPYYMKGSQLYRNHYKPNDHVKIASKIKNLKFPWLITYDNCEEIKNLYQDCKGLEFALRYSASQKNKIIATELMYYGNIKLHKPPNLVGGKE